jgi:hypothetical protein
VPVEGYIRVEGLIDLQRRLKELDGESQKKLRVALNGAAELVVLEAQDRARKDSKRAAATIKVYSGQRDARVKAGSAKVPWFGWLDFGGTTKRFGGKAGSKSPIYREFLPKGRYIYPAYYALQNDVAALLEANLAALITETGLEVDHG